MDALCGYGSESDSEGDNISNVNSMEVTPTEEKKSFEEEVTTSEAKGSKKRIELFSLLPPAIQEALTRGDTLDDESDSDNDMNGSTNEAILPSSSSRNRGPGVRGLKGILPPPKAPVSGAISKPTLVSVSNVSASVLLKPVNSGGGLSVADKLEPKGASAYQGSRQKRQKLITSASLKPRSSEMLRSVSVLIGFCSRRPKGLNPKSCGSPLITANARMVLTTRMMKPISK